MPDVEPPLSLSLVHRLAAVPEPAMRAALITEFLAGATEPEIVANNLEALIRAARGGSKQALDSYWSLVDPDVVGRAVAAARMNLLLQAAEAETCPLALQWLASTRAPDKLDTVDPERLVHRDLRKLTLGDRRAMARRAQGDGLKRLLVDPDPGVIGNLLNNPRTTEEVVVAIGARRPTVVAPLLCVLRAPRWIQRYKVKLALVRNPAFPTRFGVNLLVYLNDVDLTQIRDDGTLAQGLRLAAKRLLDVGRLG